MLISWDSVESKLTTMKPQEEVVKAEEVAEVANKTLALDQIDKTLSKPSRKLKKISQPYEREDRFDLASKELADSYILVIGD